MNYITVWKLSSPLNQLGLQPSTAIKHAFQDLELADVLQSRGDSEVACARRELPQRVALDNTRDKYYSMASIQY